MVFRTAGAKTISAATWNSAMEFDRGYGSSGTSHSRKLHISSQPNPLSKSSTRTRSAGTSERTVFMLRRLVSVFRTYQIVAWKATAYYSR